MTVTSRSLDEGQTAAAELGDVEVAVLDTADNEQIEQLSPSPRVPQLHSDFPQRRHQADRGRVCRWTAPTAQWKVSFGKPTGLPGQPKLPNAAR